MNAKQLAEKAITEADAASWASTSIKRKIAFSVVAEHIQACDDVELYSACAHTMASALNIVTDYFSK